jgi:terminal uridylyltransferase
MQIQHYDTPRGLTLTPHPRLQILTGRPERAVLALAELCVEREEELARAPRSASPAPKNVPAGRSPFALGGGWRNHMQGSSIDRLSPTLNSLLGPGELDDFNRRPFPSHMAARRGRQSEPGHPRQYSSQELWLANQGLGLDFQLPPSVGGRYPGTNDNFRGRDTSTRQIDPAYGNGNGAGHNPPRRAASITENSSNGGMGFASGSASAPISPVKAAGQLHEQQQRNYGPSGTWSTGPSPRHAQASRLPLMGDTRMYSGGGGYRRTSAETNTGGRGGAPPAASHYQAQQNRYPSSGYAQPTMSSNSRRAYSAGPSHHLGVPPNGQMEPNDSTGAFDTTSPLPAFQPFASSPPNGSSMGGQYASYISPSALLSPTPIVPPSLPMMSPFPNYHQGLRPSTLEQPSEYSASTGGHGGLLPTSGSREGRESVSRSNGSTPHEEDALAGRMGKMEIGREGAGSAGSARSVQASGGNGGNVWNDQASISGPQSNKPAASASAPTSRIPSH